MMQTPETASRIDRAYALDWEMTGLNRDVLGAIRTTMPEAHADDVAEAAEAAFTALDGYMGVEINRISQLSGGVARSAMALRDAADLHPANSLDDAKRDRIARDAREIVDYAAAITADEHQAALADLVPAGVLLVITTWVKEIAAGVAGADDEIRKIADARDAELEAACA